MWIMISYIRFGFVCVCVCVDICVCGTFALGCADRSLCSWVYGVLGCVRVCVFVCVGACVLVYEGTPIVFCACVWVCMCVYVCVCVCMCVYVCMCVSVCEYVWVCISVDGEYRSVLLCA